MNHFFKKIYFLLFWLMTIPLSAKAGTSIKNPIKADSIEKLIESILKIVVAIGAPIAVLFLIYSGFLFIKAQGKPEDLKDARKTFVWTLVGITILLGASLLSQIVAGTINQLKAGI